MYVHIYVYGKSVFKNTFQIIKVQNFKSPKCLSSVFSLKCSKYLYILWLPSENLNWKFGREPVKLTVMSAYLKIAFSNCKYILVSYKIYISRHKDIILNFPLMGTSVKYPRYYRRDTKYIFANTYCNFDIIDVTKC